MIAMGVLAMVLAQAMNVLSIEATLVARLRSVSEQGDQHQPKRGTVGQSLPGGADVAVVVRWVCALSHSIIYYVCT
jgi:hypothetical protein